MLAITELLSVFDALRRVPLAVCWIVAALVGVQFFRFAQPAIPKLPRSARDPVVLFCCAGIVWVLTLTATAAVASPPNSADAMAYHLPRVVYWAEQSSIRFFPTPYLNQIMLQPFTEYCMLHTYLLTGSDYWVNLVQWFASLASIIGVSAVAREFGAGPRGQAISALFCATVPGGILASSGAKNDYFLAMWLVAAIYCVLRFARTHAMADAVFCGFALGLAVLTKATAYLFAPWLLLAVLFPVLRPPRRQDLACLFAAGVCALLLNTPHYARNLQLSGSILGFDSAHGDGFFRWRNETFGWKQTASNMLRNLSEQLGGRSQERNQQVYAVVVRAHHWLRIDVNDPATTWRWSTFQPPRNANHEANANSQWHLLILALAGVIACWRGLRRQGWLTAVYGFGLFTGFVAFSAYLKWQPFETRLLLPLLVAGAPLAGSVLDTFPRALPATPRVLPQVLLCLFLLSVARRPVWENWVRPLKGPRSVFHVPRATQYFADMTAWDVRPAYERVADLLARSRCNTIGIDISDFPLEYPLMALVRARQPSALFLHTGVENASKPFRQPVDQSPCAVVCLNCAGDRKREDLYRSFSRSLTIGESLVFEK
jgi:4-amino-4-deoxy-L-arabinose transferase-like glycosyltransferase